MKVPRLRPNLLLLAAVALFGYVALRSLPTDRSRPETLSTAKDSAYSAKLKMYLRDSTVLDSLTRLVPTNSLFKLYRQAAGQHKVDVKLVAEIWCEELRLTTQHGIIPSDRAINRLRDTVYRELGVTDAFDYVASRAPSEGHFNSGDCGELPPRGPRVINGTSTDVEPRRPVSP